VEDETGIMEVTDAEVVAEVVVVAGAEAEAVVVVEEEEEDPAKIGVNEVIGATIAQEKMNSAEHLVVENLIATLTTIVAVEDTEDQQALEDP
jgi:hypothetical protein